MTRSHWRMRRTQGASAACGRLRELLQVVLTDLSQELGRLSDQAVIPKVQDIDQHNKVQ